MSVILKNGWFDAVIGRSVCSNRSIFIPVMGDLGKERINLSYTGEEEQYSVYDISNYIHDPTPIITSCGNLQYPETMYAIWVRGRITDIFGYGIPLPDLDADEYGLIDQTFIACKLENGGKWSAYIFVCEDCEDYDDYDGFVLSARLVFCRDKRFYRIYKNITTDFCQLLLKDPSQIHPFSSSYHYFDGLATYLHTIEFTEEYKFYVKSRYLYD